MKLKISELKPNPDNPRFIKDDKYKKLLQSLKDFPEMAEVREVVVNKDHMILGGNMRYKAMVEAGWKEVPVRVVDWSPEKQKEFIIKDNVAGGEWDWDLLANEWDSNLLDSWGVDLPTGFGDDEVVEDEAPPIADVAISKLGEVYQLGRHRLMCGDSEKDYQKVLDGAKLDMVLTDPPYGINLDSSYAGMPNDWASHKYDNKFQDKVIGDDKKFDASWLVALAKEVFTFGADYYANTLPDSGINGTWYVWDKREDDTGDSFDKMLGSPFETIWGKKKRGKRIIRMRWASFYSSENAEGEQPKGRVHPTQKPVALNAWFLKNIKGVKNIFDPYGGSGSTLIACEQLDRTCYMMELDPKYCDVIRKRYWKFVNEGNEEGWEVGTIISQGAAINA